MKIYGIGIDIVNITRIKKSIRNSELLRRIFNKREINKCNKKINSANCYAKRFAAKEAFSKALGTGFSKGINFNEITIFNDKQGKPEIKLIGKTDKIIKKFFKKKKIKIYLSLSDDTPLAVATVIIII
jgi:holo-[acyl-carrier protein] synthase